MKQKYMVIVLLVLIAASGLTSFQSYRATERLVTEDMKQALAQTMAEQQSDVISCDTIQVFNGHLQLEQLRGKAMLVVDTRRQTGKTAGFQCVPQCSAATIFAMSEQRPAMLLWILAMAWATYCFYYRRKTLPLLAGMTTYGGLHYAKAEGLFFDARGQQVRLTPMQQQLMEMFFRANDHLLTKAEICDALWPKKPDASDTLYTLIRRLKPIIEQQSNLKIEVDRGKSYKLKAR